MANYFIYKRAILDASIPQDSLKNVNFRDSMLTYLQFDIIILRFTEIGAVWPVSNVLNCKETLPEK